MDEVQKLLEEVFPQIPLNPTGCLLNIDELHFVSVGRFVDHDNLPPPQKEDRVHRMSWAMLGLGERVAEVLHQTFNDFTFIATKLGVILMIRLDDVLILIDWANNVTEIEIFSKWHELNEAIQPIRDLINKHNGR